MVHLTQLLDFEDSNWRETTVLVIDGSKTHLDSHCTEAMALLRVPYCVSGMYGFDGAPAEKLVSYHLLMDIF